MSGEKKKGNIYWNHLIKILNEHKALRNALIIV